MLKYLIILCAICVGCAWCGKVERQKDATDKKK